MKRASAIATISILTLTLPAFAKTFTWGDVETPVRSEHFIQLNEEAQSGYSFGTMHASAHLNGRSSGQIACIAGLSDQFVELAKRTPAGSTIVTNAVDLTAENCDESSNGEGNALSVSEIAELDFRNEYPSGWVGYIVGISDFLHFQAFAALGAEKADCMSSAVLPWLGRDVNDPKEWTSTPEMLFAELVISEAIGACE